MSSAGFTYGGGELHCDGVALARIAAAVGTPFYCYSSATIERHYRVFAGAFADVPALVCYAMKANSNQAVIATWRDSVPARISSPRASCAVPSPPASRPRALSSPASARRARR